ncbi:unnamed protein product [Fraxinus pennsylvanica]|uniref:Uncharacterized protein n=1 Tax=Fraxinus pennsylvanica TaxID=56036 RepID=A0AAD2ABL0_9LAMI|nr:unnamed protein product [Fraxinus pennsylvanica]
MVGKNMRKRKPSGHQKKASNKKRLSFISDDPFLQNRDSKRRNKFDESGRMRRAIVSRDISGEALSFVEDLWTADITSIKPPDESVCLKLLVLTFTRTENDRVICFRTSYFYWETKFSWKVEKVREIRKACQSEEILQDLPFRESEKACKFNRKKTQKMKPVRNVTTKTTGSSREEAKKDNENAKKTKRLAQVKTPEDSKKN